MTGPLPGLGERQSMRAVAIAPGIWLRWRDDGAPELAANSRECAAKRKVRKRLFR